MGSARFSPGEVLRGKYRIKRVLGEGGMGVVVRATHLRLDQDVAIKMLRDPNLLSRKNVIERFAREARAAARLKGDHAVRILDVDDDGEEPFLVMEYLDGSDLDRLVRKNGPLSVERAVDYALQVCEGLAEAHALGIVHRDVKPANVFVAKTPRGGEIVKILDFGISKVTETKDPTITEHERILGSPAFMSPEQLKSARDVDARSDVWSLGVVIYFLLSGRLPFDGDDATAVAARIASEDPLPLSLPAVSAELASVVMQCLVKDRDARLGSVAEVARALAPFSSGGDSAAARVSSVLRMPVALASSAVASGSGPTSIAGIATASLAGPATASLDAPIANALDRDADKDPKPASSSSSTSSTPPSASAADNNKLTASLDAPGPVSLGVIADADAETVSRDRAGRAERTRAMTTRRNVLAASAIAMLFGIVWFATRNGSTPAPSGSANDPSQAPSPPQATVAVSVFPGANTDEPNRPTTNTPTTTTTTTTGLDAALAAPPTTATSPVALIHQNPAHQTPPQHDAGGAGRAQPAASADDPLKLDIK